MPLNKEDLSFKTLINKEFTTPSRFFFQENTVSTLDINDTEVYSDTIPSTTASAVSTGVGRVLTDFVLTPDPSFPTNVFYAISGSGFTPGVGTLPSFSTSASFYQRNFISDKYGSAYTVILKDNTNTQIFPTDAIGWIFEYKTGILAIADPGSGSYTTPYKVTVVQYIGKTLSNNRINGYSGSFTGSLFGTSSYSNQALSSSYALTASFALNAGTTVNTGSFVTTSSFNSFTSSINSFTSSYNTGSFTGSFIGSLFGTSSYSNQALSSSYALTSSIAVSASYSLTSSITQQVSTSISTQNLQHNVLFIDTSGPGYIQVDGGLRYNPNQDLLTTTSSYSNQALSSSYALTASFALNAGTTIDTGSFVTTSSFNSFTSSVNTFTSSYSTGSFTGSFIGSLVGTSSYSNQALSSSYALTASFALNGGGGGSTNTGSLLTTASVNLNTITFTKGDGSTFPITVNTGSGGSSFPYTGSAIITGSLIVTGSIISTLGFTGSLFGTSSFATSASYSFTSSITQQVSTSISTQNLQHNVLFVDTSGPGFIQVDGGLRYNPNQDLLTTTSSYSNQALSSSFAITASTSITESKIITFNLGSIPTPITTGSKTNSIFYSPYSGSIKGFILTANTGSTTTLNIWKRNNTLPTSSDTIIVSNKPQLINNQFTSSFNVSNWTSSFSPNDIFIINVETNTSASNLSLQLITETYK